MQGPLIRRGEVGGFALKPEEAVIAIETAKAALSLAEPGPIITHRGPRGEVHYDIPIMYQGFALDRIHYDPWAKAPLPRGMPHPKPQRGEVEVDKDTITAIFSELRILDAAEFREPERAWAIPVAWKSFLVAYIKVDIGGREIVPDYPLTEEVARSV